ncbi:MAG: Holliday junction branch migration protein RuvA, partial [Paracoccaceae bacterium]
SDMVVEPVRAAPRPASPAVPARGAATADALSALANLGYAPVDAAGAVATAAAADPGADTGALIRAALKMLAPKG